MLETVKTVNDAVNGFVWGLPMLVLLVGTGILMTLLTKVFQISRFGYWMKNTVGAIFKDKNITAHTGKEDKAISQFQSLCTALAATIGTGNIAGVAAAIASGGPGSIFWMWIVAIFGMMTNFSENVLGIYYRRKNDQDEWSGGAMYYLQDGLGSYKGCKQLGKILAILFGVFCVLASFGIGNMSQINSIAQNMQVAFNIPMWVTGVLLMIVAALVVVGGLKRIAAVTEKLVPFMAIAYIIGALVIVLMNISQVIPAFACIFKGAFAVKAVGGGIVGSGVKMAVTWGMKRGVFSNEAGLGSSFIAIAILLFAFSTVLGWSHYGSKAFEYLFGTKATMIYKVVFVVFIVLGATMQMDLAWDLSDTFNGLMAIPNLIGVLSLSGLVAKITKNYVDRAILGKNVKPMYSAFPEIQAEQEKN